MATKLHTLFDDQGHSLEVGSKLGGGGEGDVFSLQNHPEHVLKIYHNVPSVFQIAKLKAMIASSGKDLASFSTWPLSLARNEAQAVHGFTMPKIAPGYKEILQLYSPANRKKTFPAADYSFVVHAAMNVAAAFDVIHKAGHIVGDVNQKNVLVNGEALITLIDCDSFQVVGEEGTTFMCPVGVAEYTPPELQHTPFNLVYRTFDHDDFGMAVLIFHLLFMGRHPFAGKYTGDGDQPTLEAAIEKYLFPYAKDAIKNEYVPPPLSMPMNMFPDEIFNLFEKSFSRGYEDKRPDADEWQAALLHFKQSLIRCSEDSQHKFINSRTNCPWCEFDQHGTFYFRSKDTPMAVIPSLVDQTLVKQIETIALEVKTIVEPRKMLPQTLAQPISAKLIASKACYKNTSKLSVTLFLSATISLVYPPLIPVSAVLICLWVALIYASWQYHEVKSAREHAVRELTQQLTRLKSRLPHAADNSIWLKAEPIIRAEQIILEYVGMDAKLLAALKNSESDAEETKILQYLSQFSIDTCPGLSIRDYAILRSFFVLTANDVPALGQPAILLGKDADAAMRAWKATLLQRYKSHKHVSLPQSTRNALVTQYKQTANDMEISLNLMIPKLVEAKEYYAASKEQFQAINDLEHKLAQVKANLTALYEI